MMTQYINYPFIAKKRGGRIWQMRFNEKGKGNAQCIGIRVMKHKLDIGSKPWGIIYLYTHSTYVWGLN